MYGQPHRKQVLESMPGYPVETVKWLGHRTQIQLQKFLGSNLARFELQPNHQRRTERYAAAWKTTENLIDDWSQEPSEFVGLKFGATRAQLEKQLKLQCFIDSNRNVVCTTILDLYDTKVRMALMFIDDQLASINGELPLSKCSGFKSAFLALYGQPHREAIAALPESPEKKSEALEWYNERIYHTHCDTADVRLTLYDFYLPVHEEPLRRRSNAPEGSGRP
jgi:hypothetical protein